MCYILSKGAPRLVSAGESPKARPGDPDVARSPVPQCAFGNSGRAPKSPHPGSLPLERERSITSSHFQCTSERWTLNSVHGRTWPRKRFRPAAFNLVSGRCSLVYGCLKNAVGVQNSATRTGRSNRVRTGNRTPYVVLRSPDRIFHRPRLRVKEFDCTDRPKVQ